MNTLAIAASPDHHGQRTVYLAAGEAGHVADALAALLARARAAGDPAADALADVAAQLGVREPAPAAEPVPAAPRPAPRPAPAPAPDEKCGAGRCLGRPASVLWLRLLSTGTTRRALPRLVTAAAPMKRGKSS